MSGRILETVHVPGRGALVHQVGRRAGEPAGYQPRCPTCGWCGPTVDLTTAAFLAAMHRQDGCR